VTDSRELPGMTDAKRALTARKCPPDEDDRPRRASRPAKVLPGQVDIFGRVHGLPEKRDEETGA
jgi:hypothetical protein